MKQNTPATAPLASLLRPKSLEYFIGQEHVLSPGKPLYETILHGQLHSMIFWGPPGTGKTTLAYIIAERAQAQFIPLSAVFSGVKDIRQAVEQAKTSLKLKQATILFIDEVHRFNKAQQDAFLPFVEDGTVTFIGATTENPGFEINNALLSRAKVYTLKPLSVPSLEKIIGRAVDVINEDLTDNIIFPEELRNRLAQVADGDARRVLNYCEILFTLVQKLSAITITEELINDVIQGGIRRFDKGGDEFYDQISALHKSVRGSSPDAALYWLSRMLDGGCDPLYIARRVVRMASEDIGNADPRGLQLALNAWEAYERLGSPEGELAIAQAITYLACAPKSNAVYQAFNEAYKDVKSQGTKPVPVHLRNAPTRFAKAQGHGKGYQYDHDDVDAFAAGQTYFPEGVIEKQYYHPVARGLEIKIAEKLEALRQQRVKASKKATVKEE